MPSKRRGRGLEHQSGDTLGVVECDPAGDQAGARVSGQDRSFDPQRVEKHRNVGGEVLHSITDLRLVRVTVATLRYRDRRESKLEGARAPAHMNATSP